jgi:hypothetical protein
MNIKISVIKNNYILIIIFLIFFIPRLIGLGSDISNYDADFWFERMGNFTKGVINGDFAKTHQKYHPGVTLMWVSGTSNYLFTETFKEVFKYDPTYVPAQFPKINAVSIFPLVLLISLAGSLCGYILLNLFGKKTAILFAVFLSLEPFFLGVTKFLHLSGLNAILMFTSFLVLIYYYKFSKSQRWFYFSSIIIAIALLTKIDAAIALIINLAVLCYYELRDVKSLKNLLKRGFSYVLLSFIIFYVLYPALWVTPLSTISNIINEGILNNAVEESADVAEFENTIGSRYLFYPFMIFMRSSGLFFIGVLLSSFFAIYNFIRAKKPESQSNIIYYWCMFYFIINLLALSLPGKMIDRYIVNFYPPLAVCIGYFVTTSLSRLNKKINIALTIILTAYYGFILGSNYPVFSFFHTELTQGAKFLDQVNYQVKNRGEYYAQAAYYLNSNENALSEKTLVVHAERVKTFGHFYNGKALNIYHISEKDLKNINYYVVEGDKKSYIANKCKTVKEIGPKSIFKYNTILIMKCENITFKDLNL